ncbi:putative short-chain alcohol dehydrogenase [Saccharata proteae CBS 121410]|uniref:Short-chain alcohol dehydrogenase n=1 Tax=Saccharata proteae CBS 121410 TaxID=1314787 RepID=A0A9P4HP29_9PEZI|nr:putative short-chain alcohol dehydrogenase [Saccharata proteae CBS 121410]
MSHQPRGTLVVFGSGPLIGSHIASLFASRGFQQVILLARNAQHLEKEAEFVKSAASSSSTQVHTMTIDLLDTAGIKKTLTELDEHFSKMPLECVLYNAANVRESPMFSFPAEEMEKDWKIAVQSLYIVAGWAMPHLTQLASSAPGSSGKTTKTSSSSVPKPSFLVTCGSICKDPLPALFSLSSVKACQYSLVRSIDKVYRDKGVHCGLILVAGVVSHEAMSCNPKNIADKAWGLFEQEKGDWQIEVEIPE